MTRATARMACHGLLLTTAFAAALDARTAEAATTKKMAISSQEARTFVAWNHFLSAGPSTWSAAHAPDFSPAVRSTIWQVVKNDSQAQQLANPMVDYLLWRRSINVQRFAYYHPYLNPRLAQLLNNPSSTLPSGAPAPAPPSTVSPQDLTGPGTTTTPTTTTTTPTVSPSEPIGQNVSPPSVPEPSSALLAVAMTGIGLWWRHRIGRGQRS